MFENYSILQDTYAKYGERIFVDVNAIKILQKYALKLSILCQ